MAKRSISLGSLALLAGACVATALLSAAPAQAAESRFVNSLGMEFVAVPPGEFLMGSPPGEPDRDEDEQQHPVRLTRGFYLQATEVTLAQWWAVMGKSFFRRRQGDPEGPVAKVSWYDAQRFVEALNRLGEGSYRLPTEAEWEYAARSGSTGAYSWGDTISCERAMYANNSLKADECQGYVTSRGLPPDQPAPAGSYPPNAWGLHDLAGNVWEWCADWYGPYPTGAAVDPTGPESGIGRVRRGGSWFKFGDACRSANRTYAHPASRYQTTGFRLVWSAAPAPGAEPEVQHAGEPVDAP